MKTSALKVRKALNGLDKCFLFPKNVQILPSFLINNHTWIKENNSYLAIWYWSCIYLVSDQYNLAALHTTSLNLFHRVRWEEERAVRVPVQSKPPGELSSPAGAIQTADLTKTLQKSAEY